MKSVVEGNTIGQMERFMMDHGSKIRCMGSECSLGRMERDTKESLKTIEEKVKELSHGLMGECT